MQLKYGKYHRDLVNRFVSDFNLPINPQDEANLPYFLDLYNDKFHSYDKWEELWDVIYTEFDSKPNDFLKYYYDTREKIIQMISLSQEYKQFNEMDMNIYAVKDRPNVSSNNIYNADNIGKRFVSIDLCKANYQALRYVNKNLVFGTDTYEELIEHFSFPAHELFFDYLKKSKYFRQVIFGQMNPKRHITVEKYMINKVYQLIKDELSETEIPVSMVTDEIVFEVGDFNVNKWGELVNRIKDELNIDVKCKMFTLSAYRLSSKDSDKHIGPFYLLNNIDGTVEYKGIHSSFYAIAYNLLMRGEYGYPDNIVYLDGIKCLVNEDLYLEEYIKEKSIQELKGKEEKYKTYKNKE